MHLLYDTHGKDGTPVILPQNKRKGLEERVAWVHTLCALFIGDREKVVFGCKNDGSYLGESDDENEDEDESYDDTANTNGKKRNNRIDKLESENEISLVDPSANELIILDNPHHFVVANVGHNGVEDDWSRAVRVLKDARYKCFICGLGNRLKRHTLAIPVSDIIIYISSYLFEGECIHSSPYFFFFVTIEFLFHHIKLHPTSYNILLVLSQGLHSMFSYRLCEMGQIIRTI